MRPFRNLRRELWLWLGVYAFGRALDLCELPADVDAVRQIERAMGVS